MELSEEGLVEGKRPLRGSWTPTQKRQIVAEYVASPKKDVSFCSLSIEPLDAALLDALTRLVRLLDEPALASRLAPRR